MYMGNMQCTCPHGMGLHLAKIFWNHIFSLNGLVPKFITFLVQTGQEQRCCPMGQFIIPNHPISQEQDRVQISKQMQLYSILRTGLCLTSGLTIRNIHSPVPRWSKFPAAKQALANFLLLWKLTPYPHAWWKCIFSLWQPKVREGHLQIVTILCKNESKPCTEFA